jgi:hypothetical protein
MTRQIPDAASKLKCRNGFVSMRAAHDRPPPGLPDPPAKRVRLAGYRTDAKNLLAKAA